MPTPLSLHASLTNLHRVALIRLIVIAGQLGGILFARLWLQADMDYTALLTGVALLGLLTAYTFWRLRGSEDVSDGELDRKSTRLNSSHVAISYAVFCLKKKKDQKRRHNTHRHRAVRYP